MRPLYLSHSSNIRAQSSGCRLFSAMLQYPLAAVVANECLGGDEALKKTTRDPPDIGAAACGASVGDCAHVFLLLKPLQTSKEKAAFSTEAAFLLGRKRVTPQGHYWRNFLRI